MAMWDFVKKQFIDVIQWTEDAAGLLAYRYPMQDMEIQYGAQLTVRESQMAILVNEGRVADVFEPGRYALTTATIPVLTYLNHWDKLFESPFKSDVYFFSTRVQVDQKWGTPNPITIRDQEFGAIRLRAFGVYAYRIADPKVFHVNISGTRDIYMVDDLSGQLRATIVGSITDLFASSGVAFLDMAANQDEFAAQIRTKLAGAFAALGLELTGFVMENLSLPEALQKVLDQRIAMNLVGDMRRFADYQTASGIGAAAANPSGIAGVGAGMGAGVAIGQAMAQSLADTKRSAPESDAAAASQNIADLLEKLHGLKVKGVLTEAEFNAQKAELLKKLA